MDPSTVVSAIIVATLVIILLFCAMNHFQTLSIFDSVEPIRALLDPPNALVDDVLLSRANAHHRFVDSLDTQSTFVSPDPVIHEQFCGVMLSLIDGASLARWQNSTIVAIDAYFLGTSISRLDDFIRDVTLYTVLVGLMGVDANLLDVHEVTFVAQVIGILWGTQGKTKDSIPVTVQARLLHRIGMLVRGWVSDSCLQPNPLRFVVPAYNLTWRLVTDAITQVHKYPPARLVLEDFHDNACEQQYVAQNTEGLSVESIMNETLRLFPPKRQIARVRTVPHSTAIITSLFDILGLAPPREYAVANIVDVQRSHVWGSDADVFDPMRQHSSRCKTEQKETMFAFGYGPLRCIAYNWAPKAAAVIIGAVLDRFVREGYTMDGGPNGLSIRRGELVE